MSTTRLALMDVGSNSLRLLLCDGIAADGPTGVRHSTVIGLRRAAAADDTLTAEALQRLDAALTRYAADIAAFRPARVLAVCTSAVRDAPNRADVVTLLEERLGAEVHVLTGDREAGLAFAGAALAVGHDADIMVVDVGGGSTELVTGGGGVRRAAVSLQLGAVRQTDLHVHSDPPAAAELEAVRAEALPLVVEGLAAVGGAAPAVAVAGTASTLAAMDLGVYDPRRVHRHRMSRDRVDALVDRLARVSLERRRMIPGMEPARAGVITAGAVILATVLAAAGLSEVMVSERDILDGVALAASGRMGASWQL